MEDPVCRMEVTEKSQYKSTVDGKTYYFCSKECKDKFDVNPLKYLR